MDQPTEKERLENQKAEFNKLIEQVLNLDPAKYGGPWNEEMFFLMDQLLTRSPKHFHAKARFAIELFRKFLFENGQLIAMAAHAHSVAQAKQQKEDSLIIIP